MRSSPCEKPATKLPINHQKEFVAQYTAVRDKPAAARFGRLASMTVTACCSGLVRYHLEDGFVTHG